MFAKFLKDESGASAVEYIFLVAVIGVGMTAVYKAFGGQLSTAFTTVGGDVTSTAAAKDIATFTK